MILRIKVLVLTLMLGIAVAIPCQDATAQTATGAQKMDPKTIVGTVDGQDISLGSLMLIYDRLPDQVKQMGFQALFPTLLERAVDGKLIAKAARDAGVDKMELAKKRLSEVEDQIISEIYLTERIGKEITDESLKERYDATAGDMVKEELNARHILLAKKEEAEAVIDELSKGADFAALAKEKSTGPSGASGGDLGWFSAEQMVPEFSAAAQALEPGSFTEEPVKTQFGWHVIKLEDRRKSEPPSFESSKQKLSAEMTQEYIKSILDNLRSSAEIARFDLSGAPVKQ